MNKNSEKESNRLDTVGWVKYAIGLKAYLEKGPATDAF